MLVRPLSTIRRWLPLYSLFGIGKRYINNISLKIMFIYGVGTGANIEEESPQGLPKSQTLVVFENRINYDNHHFKVRRRYARRTISTSRAQRWEVICEFTFIELGCSGSERAQECLRNQNSSQ